MAISDPRPAGARVTEQMVGSSTALRPVSWTERDTMLYALGVGAGLGAADRELHFTTENTGGVALKTVPSFITLLAVAAPPPALAELDIGRFLHAEQSIQLARPLPPIGAGFVRNKVIAVEDKGSGALVRNASTLYADRDEQTVLARSSSTIFVQGGGGFGGPRPSSPVFSFPERPPDFSVVHETRPEQALLYRLSGDRHRLHSDPGFSQERGFPQPILHGLCTYGFACRALVEALAGTDAERLAEMQARFARPVVPGECLKTDIWQGDAGLAMFRTVNRAGEAVLDRGTARFRNNQSV